MERTEQQDYIDFLRWHHGRLGEILDKIDSEKEELSDADTSFLSAISKTYYKKQRDQD